MKAGASRTGGVVPANESNKNNRDLFEKIKKSDFLHLNRVYLVSNGYIWLRSGLFGLCQV